MTAIVPFEDGKSERAKKPSFTSEEIETFLGMVERIKEMGTHEGVQPDELTFGSVTGWIKELKGNEKVKRKRIQTKFKERRLSSGLILNMRERNREDVTFEERFNELVDIKDGNMNLAASVKGEGVRYVHTPGLYFSMKPEIEDVTIYDSVCLSDYLFKFKVYFKLYQASAGIFFLLGFSIFFSPILWMDVTGTDIIFFGNETSSPPLSSGLVAFSTNTFLILCAGTAVAFTNAVLMVNPSMLRLQWQTSKTRISVTLALNIAYAASAISMFPNPTHVLYMYARTVVITCAVFFDSIFAHMKLRFTPKLFAKQWGGTGKTGFVSFAFGILGFLLILTDAFRHYVIMFVTDDVSLISINVTNPFNGNTMAFTNKRLSSITYFNGIIFAAIALKATLDLSKMKTMSQTKFMYKS